MNAILERLKTREQGRDAAARDVRARYRGHLVAYNTSVEVDPDQVIADCESLGKAYDEFLADAERVGKRMEQARLAAELPAIIAAMEAVEARDQAAGVALKKAQTIFAAEAQAVREERAALSGRHMTASMAEADCRNGCDDPELLARERPLGQRCVALAREMRNLEDELLVTNRGDSPRAFTAGKQLAIAKTLFTEARAALGSVPASAPSHLQRAAQKAEAELKRTEQQVAAVNAKLASVKAQHAEVIAQLAGITAEKLLP